MRVHYVNGAEKVTADFSRERNLRFFDYLDSAQKLMHVFEGKDSIGLTDLTNNGLNKIHIGSKICKPHAESSRNDLRVDLASLDLLYASLLLQELENWRLPEKRQKLAEWYKMHNWHHTDERIKQLQISPAGLEGKIQETRSRINTLSKLDNNSHISSLTMEIERRYCAMRGIMCDNIPEVLKKRKQPPKIVEAQGVIDCAKEIYALLATTLEFISARTDIEEANTYWQRTASWAEL